jgi:hypothetical protein
VQIRILDLPQRIEHELFGWLRHSGIRLSMRAYLIQPLFDKQGVRD